MRAWISFFLAILLSLPLEAGPNAKNPSVVVLDLVVPEEQAANRQKMANEITRAFERTGKVRLLPSEEVEKWKTRESRENEGPTPNEELKASRELLSQGKKAYHALKFKVALGNLEEARKDFIRKLSLLRSNRDLIDVHLYLGMTYVALKDKSKAKESFQRVVSLDPTRELQTRDFSPEVIETFSKVKQEMLATDTVQVRILSDPVPGKAYLNGKLMGTTPLDLKLVPGEYFVLVERSGMKLWYEPVKLKKRLETVRASLQPLESEAWGDLFRTREGSAQQSDDVSHLIQSGVALGSDFVFLGNLEKDKNYRLLGQLFDVRTSDFSQVAVLTLSDNLKDFGSGAQDLVDTLVTFIRDDGYLVSPKSPDLGLKTNDLMVGGAPVEPAPKIAPTTPKKWYQHWWVWPIVGGAVVGIALGASQLGGTGGSEILVNNRGNF